MRVPTHRFLTVLAAALALTTACDSTDDAVKSAEDAARKASKDAVDASKKHVDNAKAEATRLGDEAVDASKQAAADLTDEAVDASKKAAGELVDATKTTTRKWVEDFRNDGELSTTAKAWIGKQASETSIEGIVVKGTQLAPVAMEASKVLLDAVDSETLIEPIFQKIDEDPKVVDKAIGDMPRVEVVDGVTVGFRQMDQVDTSTRVKERGYLVMWRHENHLVGFVYRSTRTINVDQLVAETPRLIELTQRTLTD